MQGAGWLCPSQLATVALGLCQPHAPPCSNSARDALQRLAHDNKDRFGQSSLSSTSGELDRALVHGGWRNVIWSAWCVMDS